MFLRLPTLLIRALLGIWLASYPGILFRRLRRKLKYTAPQALMPVVPPSCLWDQNACECPLRRCNASIECALPHETERGRCRSHILLRHSSLHG